MVYIPKNPVTQDTILAAIRTAVRAAGGRRIGYRSFLTAHKMRPTDILRYFTCWNEALVSAGFHFQPWHEQIPLPVLLADWGRVARKLRHAPNLRAYSIHGNYDSGTFRKRFGSWINACRAFRKFAAGKREWADVLPFCPPIHPGAKSRGPFPGKRRPRLRRANRPTYGDPIGLPGLSNAPVNESGVICLFGILAHRLGFQIEALRPAFPDCLARRCVAPGIWQDVAIEFEYESRNFRDHCHPPNGCDLIVCWKHNWLDCPKSLEVIALSEELQRLKTSTVPLPDLLPPLLSGSVPPCATLSLK